jgi:hypothetical protein
MTRHGKQLPVGKGATPSQDALDYFVQVGDDLLDGLSHLPESWHERLSGDGTWDPRTLAERYAEAEVAIHVHLRLKTAVVGLETDLRDYCIVFEQPAGLDADLSVARDALGGDNLELCFVGDESDDGDRSVLVGIGERVEDGEWMRVRVVPSVVRLRLVKNCDQVLGDAPEHGGRLGLPVLPGAADRESALVVGIERQFVGELIEGGPKTMNGVTGDYSPFDNGDRLENLEPKQVLRSLRIRLSVDPVETFALLFKEPLASLVERVQVLYRPIDLREDRHDVGRLGRHEGVTSP